MPARAAFDDLLDVGAPGFWRATASPFTQHVHNKPEFQYVWGVGVERQRDDHWLYGLAYISNSFGQDCGYLYLGQQYPDLLEEPKFYFQWSAGVLYGYKGQYQHRVPLNQNGFAPGLVLSLGWQFDESVAMQVNKAGSAFMLQLSYAWR